MYYSVTVWQGSETDSIITSIKQDLDTNGFLSHLDALASEMGEVYPAEPAQLEPLNQLRAIVGQANANTSVRFHRIGATIAVQSTNHRTPTPGVP